MKTFGKILIVVLALVILIGAGNCFVVTQENEYTIINTDGIIAMQDYIKGLYLVEMANDKTVLLDEEEAKKVFEAIGVSLP